MNMIYCVKLERDAPGLDRAPLPGDIGERILKNISQEAWVLWLGKQTILINEYRLNPIDFQAREFLQEQLLDFLFGEEKAS